MPEKERAEILPRLTFENVLENQIALRDKIGMFIAENRTLNAEEKQEFERLYYRATLGKGALVTPLTDKPGLGNTTLDDIILNHLSVPRSKGVETGWTDTDEREFIKPAEVWKLVLQRLNLDVFGAALQQAIALSPEKEGGAVYGGLRGTAKRAGL